MTPSQRIQEIKSRLEKALTGPGKIMMTRPMDDSLEELERVKGERDELKWRLEGLEK